MHDVALPIAKSAKQNMETVMKKFKILILITLLIGALSVFAGCGIGEKLDAPNQVEYNIENELTWAPVEGARGYYVEIIDVKTGEDKGVSVKRTANKLSLSFLAEGDYDIRVRALTKDEEEKTKWSTTIYFQKGYETGCVYTLINDETEYRLTRYGTAPSTIYIEDEYRKKPVTEIGARAFKGYSIIEHVEIGDNVRSIGDNAFYGCKNLKTIKLGDSVTEIGTSAFQSCIQLENIIFTDSVTTIQGSAFAYCRALKSMDLPDNLQTIGTYAFSDCTALEEVVLPDSLTSLGGAAFTVNNSLKKVTFGSGLTEISASVFYKCPALETVEFAEGGALKTIGVSAFADCYKLASITIPKGVETIGAKAFAMQLSTETTEEGETLISVQSTLTDVGIPSTITSIGTDAFAGTKFYMDAMTGNDYIYVGNWIIGAPNTLKETLTSIPADGFKEGTYGIADSALMGFKVLEKVYLPDSVCYIGGAAFQSNEKLFVFQCTDDSLLKKVGMYSFAGCRILKELILGPKVEVIEEGAFMSCTLLNKTDDDENVLTPKSLVKVGQKAFEGTKLAEKPDESGVIYADKWLVGYAKDATVTSVTLRSDTVGIADYAFANCENLSSLIIPNKNDLKYIGRGAFCRCMQLDMLDLIEDYAFYACTSLSSVKLPQKSLTSVGRSAFYNCFQLSKLDLSKTSVQTIGDRAFNGCANLKEVNFGNKLTTIGFGAFYDCQRLEKVVLPDTVTTVSDYAFFMCYSLKDLSLSSNITEIGNYTFSHCVALERVALGKEIKSIGDYAFYACEALKLVSLNEGLESIGDYAFLGALALSEVKLPSTLISVGDYAFAYNEAMQSIILHDAIKEVGQHVFYACKALTIYSTNETMPTGWDTDWNSFFNPVIFGCTLSEDGEYIVSVTITEGALENVWATQNIAPPERLGYTFDGWAVEADGEVVYTMEQIAEVAQGTTLYSKWAELQLKLKKY